VPSESNIESHNQQLNFLVLRLNELNNTASQILIFLSFAIVAAVTFLTPSLDFSRRTAVHWTSVGEIRTDVGCDHLHLPT
jgi:hypothetical protein